MILSRRSFLATASSLAPLSNSRASAAKPEGVRIGVTDWDFGRVGVRLHASARRSALADEARSGLPIRGPPGNRAYFNAYACPVAPPPRRLRFSRR